MKSNITFEQKPSLFFIDLILLFLSIHLAIYIRYIDPFHLFAVGYIPYQQIASAFPLVIIIWIASFRFFGLYHFHRPIPLAEEELYKLFKATISIFLVLMAFTFFYRGFSYSRGMVIVWLPSTITISFLGRRFFHFAYYSLSKNVTPKKKVAIVGKNDLSKAIIEGIQPQQKFMEFSGFIFLDFSDFSKNSAEFQWLGTIEDIPKLKKERKIDLVIIADTNLAPEQVMNIINLCMSYQIEWKFVPNIFQLLVDKIEIESLGGIPLIRMKQPSLTSTSAVIKRLFDIAVSATLLLLLSPLMTAIAIAIKLSSNGPVFYKQYRIGYKGLKFSMLKFRSMHQNNDNAIHKEYVKQWIQQNAVHSVDNKNNEVYKITNDPRIFMIGKYMRKFSLDELPQLFNVLVGQMSLIGPRPPLEYEVEIYNEWHKQRFNALPGITGLWQVSGRNRLSFEEMIHLDIQYIENWSLLLDFKIMFRTISVVLFEHAY